MNALVRGLTWPIVTLLIIGSTHFLGELARPEMQAVFIPPVVMPIYLAVGGWAGFLTVRSGGTLAHGILAGAILGVLPVMLQVVGFGLILGRDGATVTSAALLGLLGLFWGGTIGAGVARSLLVEVPADTTARRPSVNSQVDPAVATARG